MTATTDAIAGPWNGPYGLPAFHSVHDHDFLPAFEAAMAQHLRELDAIKAQQPATFENTIEAMERAGGALDRTCALFFNKSVSNSNAEIEAIEREIGPRLSAHRQANALDRDLWQRIQSIETTGLSREQARVLELTRRRFRASGADLDDAGRARLTEITQRLSVLGTEFAQAVLKAEQSGGIVVPAGETQGLPEWLVAAGRKAAAARAGAQHGPADGEAAVADNDGGCPQAAGTDATVSADALFISTSRSMVMPFLQASPNRALREAAWRAWSDRGEAENWPRINETLALRQERAELLGHDSYAHAALEHQMAGNPQAVDALLQTVWEPAKAAASRDAEALAVLAAADGINGPLRPWDWRYYAERQREKLHDLNDAELMPFLSLDAMIAAAFDVAGRLFGLSFSPVDPAVALHHEDARAWEVTRNGDFVGLFIGDYFARPSKRSGAWASTLRDQQKLSEPGRPIVLNTCNFVKGTPTLLSWDDARTLFHEFGHALHMLLSDVTYPSVSGTNVARDFVELPSQLYEHWLGVPEVLARHARHVETGAPMPEHLVARIKAAETFDQGFATVEYLGSAIVDMRMHTADPADIKDAKTLEQRVLDDIGMPAAIGMRHRSPHFLHVFAGPGYAAGYYSYLWS